ncbi:MAG: ABC transporter permease, partial [Armatimonadetes bacterium]|nr:ABC transporter permease [Armatimonadota bacterium]
VLDGSDAVTANTALSYMQALIQRVSTDTERQWALRAGLKEAMLSALDVRTQVLYNPELNSAAFVVPGLIGVVMALMAALLTSTCIVREREVGTMEALLATPVRASEVILGKLLPYAGLAMIDIALCVAAGAAIFGVFPRGSLVQLIVVSAGFVLACLAMGLAISGLAGSQRTAIVGGIMTLMLPTILLSGFIFPIENFPRVLQGVAYLLPATHYLVAMRVIYLRAVSLLLFWRYLLALAVLMVVMLAAAVKVFRAKL